METYYREHAMTLVPTYANYRYHSLPGKKPPALREFWLLPVTYEQLRAGITLQTRGSYIRGSLWTCWNLILVSSVLSFYY